MREALSNYAQTDDDSIHDRSSFISGGVRCYHRNCALGLAFPSLFQSLRKCAIFSHSDRVRCTQIPIEFLLFYPRHSIACTSPLQRFVTMDPPHFRYSSSHISPGCPICSHFRQLLPSNVNQILCRTTIDHTQSRPSKQH
jgi:hypothetical protein